MHTVMRYIDCGLSRGNGHRKVADWCSECVFAKQLVAAVGGQRQLVQILEAVESDEQMCVIRHFHTRPRPLLES